MQQSFSPSSSLVKNIEYKPYAKISGATVSFFFFFFIREIIVMKNPYFLFYNGSFFIFFNHELYIKYS